MRILARSLTWQDFNAESQVVWFERKGVQLPFNNSLTNHNVENLIDSALQCQTENNEDIPFPAFHNIAHIQQPVMNNSYISALSRFSRPSFSANQQSGTVAGLPEAEDMLKKMRELEAQNGELYRQQNLKQFDEPITAKYLAEHNKWEVLSILVYILSPLLFQANPTTD